MTGRPVGRVTRGTTHPNRLRRFDCWILHLAGPAISATAGPLAVDLGYGSNPRTLLDFDAALRGVHPGIHTVGVEIDRTRVQRAREAGMAAVHGGFEIPVEGRPIVVRAANVLRQYEASEVPVASAQICERLAPVGWLVEGTCDESGRLACFLSVDSTGTARWCTISVRLGNLMRPSRVAARLPKALIHRNVPGEPIHALLADLDDLWERAPRWGARERWLAVTSSLSDRGWTVRDDARRWPLGELTVSAEELGPW